MCIHEAGLAVAWKGMVPVIGGGCLLALRRLDYSHWCIGLVVASSSMIPCYVLLTSLRPECIFFILVLTEYCQRRMMASVALQSGIIDMLYHFYCL